MQNERRIATWRTSSVPTRSISQELAAGAFLRAKLAVLAFLGLLILGLLVGAFPSLESFRQTCEWAAAPAGICVLFAAASELTCGGYDDLLPVHDYGDALPRMNVVIHFEVDGHVYGRDRGELTLVEDWLVFEGERTNFSLAANDLTEPASKQQDRGRRQISLGLRGTTAKICMTIIAEGPPRDPSDFLSSFLSRMTDYPGISVLPPLESMPNCWRARFLRGLGPPGSLALLVSISLFANAVLIELVLACATLAAFGLYFEASRRRALRRLAATLAEFSTAPPAVIGQGQVVVPAPSPKQSVASTR
jgi:hypothetical protein